MRSSASNRTNSLYATNSIDLRALYYILRERVWVIALSLLVVGLATTAYLIRAPKIYAANVVVQVEQEEQKIINIERIQQENLGSLESLKTVEQTLQNRSLLARVIEANHLAKDRRFVSPTETKPPSSEQLVSRLAEMVQVKLRKGTRLIDITVQHTNPSLTELVANSLIAEFLRQSYEQNSSASQLANQFLLTEAETLKQKLEKSENALQDYKEGTQSASLEDQQNVVVQKLRELSAKVTEAKSQRILHETASRQVEKLGKDSSALLVIPAVANHPAIVEIRSNISKLESEIANLKQRYREKHPKYIQAHSQLAEWKNGLNKAILSVPHTIRAAYESAQAGEQALEQALREQEVAALELNKQSIRYNVLARDVESDRALYQSVIKRIKETSVTKEIKPSQVRLLQPATAPEYPIKPEKIKVVLMGLLAGLGGGLMLALLLNGLDRSLKTVDQTEEYLELPVLSAIPTFNGVATEQQRLIMADEARSAEAESFRTLRTGLSMLGRKEDRKTFLFTSALPSEGKTFCSLNYALSLAQQGLKTLIIDCDLRRPMVEKTLVSNNKRGFGVTDFLTGQQAFSAGVHTTDVENFSYMPAGTNTPNPAELLAKTGIDGLIEEALQHFDRVVVDSAPIHAVSDTLLILNRIQTVCLVVRARKTPRNSVLRALQLLREADAPLAGVILNLLPRSRGAGYYYDSYYDYAYRGEYAEKKAIPA